MFRSAFISAGQLVGNTQLATLDNIASASRSPYRKVTINGDVTAFKNGWIGSHEFQAGLFIQPMKRRDEIIHANGGFGLEEHVLRDANNPCGRDDPLPSPHLRARAAACSPPVRSPTTRSTSRTRGGRWSG